MNRTPLDSALRQALDPALALSGWLALAATALPAATPLRVLVTAGFLVLGPGGAAVRLSRATAHGRQTHSRRTGALEAAVLTVALSLVLDTLVAEGFYLVRGFSTGRELAVLAALTTLLTALARWLGHRAPAGPAERPQHLPSGPDDPHGNRSPAARTRQHPTRHRHAGAALAAAGLLAFTAACGSGGTTNTSGSGSGSTADMPKPGDPSSPAAPGPWQLVLNDDFNGTHLDTAKWATCYDWNDGGCTNSGNKELEWYLPGQATVNDGALGLTAKRATTPGTDGHTYPWRSGMISTGRDSWSATPRHTFTHGYFAAAVRIPAADGLFPAFWLMPDTRTTPPELDIAEFISSTQEVQMTVHWADPGGGDQHQAETYGPQDFTTGYHVFALDWETGSLTWYVDGVQRYQVTDPGKIPNVPMELLLNLAVGYPDAPPESLSSATMQVDWIRVWQH